MVIEIDYIGNGDFLFLKSDKIYNTRLVGDDFKNFQSKELSKNIDNTIILKHIYLIKDGMICIRINYEEFEEFFLI